MTRSLSERVAQRARTKDASKPGRNRAVFLALRDDVRQALDDGWSVRAVWETLSAEGRIEVGYDAFLGYVNQLIGPQRGARTRSQPNTRAGSEAAAAVDRATGSIAARPAAVGIAGFRFESTPRKEDLL